MYKTLIVLDQPTDIDGFDPASVISFQDYLREYPKLNEPRTRIINLCDTEHYLSRGYYCSLLAEARKHLVLPSVKTINTLRHFQTASEELLPSRSDLQGLGALASEREYLICFGQTDEPALSKLAARLFHHYAVPILKLRLLSENTGLALQLESVSYNTLAGADRERFLEQLRVYTDTVWRINVQKKRSRWDMAILVNPEEKDPPSNREALQRFVKAAAKQGIAADLVDASQLVNLSSYDALFIRETTAIDHPTYKLASRAEKAGLVVIDDADSILRCCNKVFLHDAFSYRKVPSLRTQVVDDASDATLDLLEESFGYPLVLKMPEGSFSKGVFKVESREALRSKLEQLLKDSALMLAQEYLYTEFDWRIGILNGRAIYACKYMMARNHWQIYNPGAKRFYSGDFETLPTFEVPKVVLDAALKSAAVVGQGLYGVDLKHKDGKAYVIEVNDNPSIDHKVEDAYLGDELYMQIMAEFHRRLEARGR